MTGQRLSEVLQLLTERPTRRNVSQALAGIVFAGSLDRVFSTPTSARRKRKRKKRKRCKGGRKKCGKGCCTPQSCIGGSCCPAARTCGDVCCAADELCGNPDLSICVTGQGACPTGANSCTATITVCNGSEQCFCVPDTSGNTRCATPIGGVGIDDCGHCTSDADCQGLFPDIVGVFCARDASGECGCPVGQNVCGAPCPFA